ncbi:U-box domain-containing protein 7-like [Dorcoceras hygrometricum]|uniref:U-box domain-containing protein 7-like n=1 Tax=Dorcoceras hygrometricum TaxID=472368 RepID=A0A2Z7CYN0_9LAMI|nr:U-box domain-containing protein 7-like [Dorcoceras hygrometricum]
MVKCGGGRDSNSVALDRPLKLWSLIIDSVRCGGGGGGGGIQGDSRRREEGAKSQAGSEKLSEILKQPEWWENEEVRRKEEALGGLKSVAQNLQGESMAAVVEAATEVRRLTKDDPQARTTLALLGAIPPLVALLDGGQDPTFNSQITALYALLNLAIGNDANKSAIVKAGAVHKMLKLVRSLDGAPNRAVAEAVVANFLGLSALDSNKPIIGSSGAIPFLVETLQKFDENVGSLAKTDSLRALYNLSILALNVYTLLETDLVPYLVNNLGDMEPSEIILSILSNVVAVSEGRRRIGAVPDAFPILVDVLNWTDSPGCQEKATYILIVMAHKSYGDRRAMIDAGIVLSLLELTLLGTPLAQKRASRMLECLRADKGKQVSSGGGGGGGGGAVSAPLIGTSLSMESELSFGDEDEMMSQEKKAVKQLVQQSLHSNMKRMVKRANLPHDFVPSDHLKSLTLSSTSKSLPF